MKRKMFYAMTLVATLLMATPGIAQGASPSPLPPGYYCSECQQPSNLTFYDWMAALQIPPYRLNAFDCSQMAAYVEWLAESCGHEAILLAKNGEEYGHAWVAIDIGGVFLAYEATWATREHVDQNPWILHSKGIHSAPDAVWDNLYNVPWWGTDGFEMEFAWWLTHPSLVNDAWPIRLGGVKEDWE